MGVIRPPWISKEDFYRTPFNFCDRWCERCHLTSICKVYQEGEKDKKRAIREGKDPNSWEFTFEVMQKNLKKVGEMIARDAKRLGIDLEQITQVSEKEYDEYVEEQEKLKEHPLQKFSNKWSDYIHSFLKKFTEVPIEVSMVVAMEAREILGWYHTLVPAKVHRALDSDKREKEYPEDWRSYDEKTSAFIAYNGLVTVSEALMRLAAEKLPQSIKEKCLFLSKESLDLAQYLSKVFYLDDRKKVH